MIVFVHGWYIALLCSDETTGFFGTSWSTSQPVCGMVAKKFIRPSSSGLEFSSDSIDWRLNISQNLEFATLSWCGRRAVALNGHRFSISLFRSSKESKLSPSCVRSQFDMPESAGNFNVDDTKIQKWFYEQTPKTSTLRRLTTLLQSAIFTFLMEFRLLQRECSTSTSCESIEEQDSLVNQTRQRIIVNGILRSS